MDSLAVNVLDATSVISTFGLIGILAIIFAETGLLVGFFFPGDSMLFLAGVAASSSAEKVVGTTLPLTWLLIGAPLCAIAGAQLGHLIGTKAGPKMFNKPNSKLFKKEYVEKAEHYFEKFGPAKAVVLARFIPIVRTFLNPVAGVLEMPARKFFVWNVVGGVVWTVGIILAGYFLGDAIGDSIDKYLLPGIAVIVVISLLPIIIEVFRERRAKKRGDGPSADRAEEPVAQNSN
ncbi:VTT domain-containing protein [Yinghuangia sp. ASG 101]|uniref:DedA family protein n=1 Tax=Yinghuangia sp. ASG 101 TaxID=2896848 RepID=UPI001E5E6BDB|nr:VTT domain-containing protein [Yinghuangia sp. ASG 101]UGQ15099.1 VTT domain-containing protein [Yinghuangia sp. ASG 101]